MKWNSPSRLIAAIAVFALVAPARGEDRADWLRIAPGDAHFYVEIRGLNEIRSRFASLGIWETVQGLGTIRAEGVPPPAVQLQSGEGDVWKPDVAIAVLLGHRSAMLSSTAAGWQGGLVVCEAINETHIEMMLQLWAARRTGDEGPVKRYVLEGGSLLALRGSTMVFGPAGDPDGLWGRAVLLLAGQRGPTLGARAEFASLKTRLSKDYPALVYSSWPEGDTGAFAGCERLIAGASVETDRLVCELYGQLSAPQQLKPIDRSWLKSVPSNTIAVWSGSYESAMPSSTELIAPPTATIAEFLTWMMRALDMSSSRIIEKLGPGFTIIVGTQQDSKRPVLLLPQLTVALDIDSTISLNQLDNLFSVFVRLLVAMTSTRGQPLQSVEINETSLADVPCRIVPIGPALAQRTGFAFLRDAEFCWALVDGRLLLSTSSRHLKEIMEARGGKKIESLGLPTDQQTKLSGSLWIRGDKLAEMCASWLDELQRENPAAMQSGWWRRWASGKMANQSRLGLGLVDDPAHPQAAIVREINDDSPARGLLQIGDVVTSASGEPLTGASPAKQIAERYASRGAAREFQLELRRGPEQRRVVIPVEPLLPADLKDFDPVHALRQVIALAKQAASISVSRFVSRPERLEMKLEVKWNPAPEATD
jgi:hypothetical protein